MEDIMDTQRTEVMPAEIAKALVKAQALIRAVGHDATNSFHRYRYTSAEALLDASREPMAAAGLALVQCGWSMTDPRVVDSLEWVPAVEGRDGKGDRFIAQVTKEVLPGVVRVRYLLTHDSGAAWELPPVECPVIPEAGRPWDKAMATALTYALGYALRGLLKIPRTGDPDKTESRDDVDQRDDSDTTARGAKTAAKKRGGADPLPLIEEALAAQLDPAELRKWCKEYGGKALKAVGIEKIRRPLLAAAERLEVAEMDVMAWVIGGE